jgi:poly-gamma-glutamate synthesis protein (capsule biosynthesis protein)
MGESVTVRAADLTPRLSYPAFRAGCPYAVRVTSQVRTSRAHAARAAVGRLAVAGLVLLGLLAACSNGAPEPGGPAAGTADPSTTGEPETGPQEITLTFGGDVHFSGRTLDLLDHPSTAFGPVAKIFTESDLAMVNLESAVTNRGTPEPKTFLFRTPPTAYAAIAAAGIDVVSLANNHALDYGRVGLEDALNYSQSMAMPIVGVGRNADEAYGGWTTTVKGVKIAVLGFSQVAELSSSWAAKDNRSGMAYAFDMARSVAAVEKAKAAADVVVVYMHWGQEYNECPTNQMKTFAKKIADAGATMIIGTHAHNLVGDGWLGKTFVQYGLSNFLWWRNDAGSNDTGVLRVTLTGPKITKTEFLPAYIDRTTGQPIPSTGAEADRIAKKYASLHGCTGLAASPPG